MNACLVTGCAGFIGSHLVERLLDEGSTVVGLDAYTEYYARELKEQNLERARGHPRFSLVEGDLLEVDLPRLISRVDAVFHLAAQAGVRGSWGDSFATYARNNLVATQRLFEAAADAHLRVVWASSSSVYGDAETYPTREDGPLRPVSPYGVTKLACEQLAATYARSFGLDEVALRYFTVYGPRQRPDMAFTRITRALWTGEAFRLFGTGEQSRDVTYAHDAVAATVAAMERAPAGAVYNVGGGSEISLRDAVQTCERLSGRRLDVVQLPAAPGDARRTAADTTRIREQLGWRPRTSVEEGLRAQLESMRDRLARTLEARGLRGRGRRDDAKVSPRDP